MLLINSYLIDVILWFDATPARNHYYLDNPKDVFFLFESVADIEKLNGFYLRMF